MKIWISNKNRGKYVDLGYRLLYKSIYGIKIIETMLIDVQRNDMNTHLIYYHGTKMFDIEEQHIIEVFKQDISDLRIKELYAEEFI